MSSTAFSVPSSTSVFVVGPHCLLTYGTTNPLVLNDRTPLEGFWVDDFTGFESPDVSTTAQASPGEIGEIPDPGSLGGRTLGLSGRIKAASYPAMLELTQQLLDAFSGVLDERELLISTHDSVVFNQPPMRIFCRPSDRPTVGRQIGESDLSGLLERSFSISLRASADPTFTGVDLLYQAFKPQVLNILGRTYDRSYDLAYTTAIGPDDLPAESGNSFSAVHAGNFFARPVIRFTGAMGGVVFTNESTGQVMRLTRAISSNDSVTIDIKTGDIVDGAGRPAAAALDSTSDWTSLAGYRDVPDGINVFSLSVSSFGPNAAVELWWRTTNISG